MTISWWMFLVAGVLLGMASAFCAMLSLSAGTAFATDYHTLSPRQRVMAKLLGVFSLGAAFACGLAALASVFWGLRGLYLLFA